MKVYTSIDQFEKLDNAIVTTGTFDGVHIGHQKIISRLKEIAKLDNGETVLLTFFPHPRVVLFPDNDDLKMLSSEEEKISLLEYYGIDHLIIHPFTKEFSRLGSVEFVRNILVNKIGTKKLVIGYNHHFGRNREGTFEHLKEFGHIYGFNVEEIPAQDIDNVNVSSTKIRNAILAGDIKTASLYLGHLYSLSGIVIEGNKLGRKIGFPTANLFVEHSYKMIPLNGVYAVDVSVSGRKFSGMLNIGNRPTVGITEKTIEVNIFDFDEDIYDQKINVYFKERIRDEVKFPDLNALKDQLTKDKITASLI